MSKQSESHVRKLRKIKDICTTWTNSITHKPYDSKIDQARTQSLVGDILKVLWKENYKETEDFSPIKNKREYWLELEKRKTVDPEVQKETNRKGLAAIREMRKKSNG